MKKVIRDNLNFPIGYAETIEKKGAIFDGAYKNGKSVTGVIAETLQSLDSDLREYIEKQGEII